MGTFIAKIVHGVTPLRVELVGGSDHDVRKLHGDKCRPVRRTKSRRTYGPYAATAESECPGREGSSCSGDSFAPYDVPSSVNRTHWWEAHRGENQERDKKS